MSLRDRRFDAIVIGAGHNGLVAAAYLARAGLKTLVLERREILGGAAATEPVFPGYQVDTGAFDSGLFMPEIVSDLGLERHGLRFLYSPSIVHTFDRDGPGLTLWRDAARAAAEIARLSPADAAKYPAYLKWISRMASVLREVALLTPPAIPGFTPGELLPWLKVALRARGLGRKDLMAFVRMLPMAVYDFLDEWFETPSLKATLASAGLMGAGLGPRSPGTALLLLYQAMNGPSRLGRDSLPSFRASSFVQGGMGRLSAAIADAARQYGAEICTGLGVSQILLQDEAAVGVRLENGEEIPARWVFSSTSPRHTFFELVGAHHLEVRVVREVKNIRYRGSVARLNLALDGLPAFHGLLPESGASTNGTEPGSTFPSGALSGHLLVCPSLDYAEKAFDTAKYGAISPQPMLDMAIPTILDPSLAPEGKHLLCINIQYAPYFLTQTSEVSETSEVWGPAQRDLLMERVLDTLQAFAPDIHQRIEHHQLLTPLDLERQYGLAEGNLFHGQMALDQLFFMRPIAGYGRYRTPIANLYLCGAGAHPGGGVIGAPGRNAALQALKDR